MGYRSDVAIAVYGEDKIALAKVKQFYESCYAASSNSCKLDLDYLVKRSMEYTEKPIFNDKCEFLLLAKNVKWYDGYPWVEFLRDLLEYARELELCVEFVRFGEELEDTEEEYDNTHFGTRLQIHRTINIDM